MRYNVFGIGGRAALVAVLSVSLVFQVPTAALAEGEDDQPVQQIEAQGEAEDSQTEEVPTEGAAEKPEESKDELNELQEQVSQRNDLLDQQMGVARETLASLNSEAELAEYDLLTVTSELDSTTALIADLDQQIPETQAKLETAREQLAELISQNYKDGGTTLLDVLLDVTSFDDFLTRVEYANRINQYKSEVVTQTQDLNSQLVQQRYDLELEKLRQEQLVQEQQQRVAAVEAAAASTQSYYNQLSSELQGMIAAEEEAQRATNEEASREAAAEALKLALEQSGGSAEAAAGVTGITLAPALDATTFVSRAFSIIGAGYQWSGYVWTGSRRDSAFTCSGVVDFARGRAAKSSSPEILYAEVGSRLVTDVSQLQYGDLVFYAYAGRKPGHVGIYVGGGSIIDSVPDVGVSIHDVNYMEFMGGGSIY